MERFEAGVLRCELNFAGEDMSLTVSGGDRPHIGGVSVAIARESLTGTGVSATVSTFNLTGHKDSEIGDFLARELAAFTGKTCVVCCGVHIENADPAAIENVLANSKTLLSAIKAYLQMR